MAVFRADMAGLGKYHMGGYGRIGVYRGNANHYGINVLGRCSIKTYEHCQ